MNKIIFSILLTTSILSIANAEMSNEEFRQELLYCGEGNKTSCQYLIDSGNLKTPKQCDKDNCIGIGDIYRGAGYTATAIEYYKRAISLGNEEGIILLENLYYDNKDYINVKKCYELAIKAKDKAVRARGFVGLGLLYAKGFGVRQDNKKAFEYFKKSCDIGVGKYSGMGCNMVGASYHYGVAVKQNLSIAKEYYGKGCDLGVQESCELYKKLNERGIR